jgi:osmotically-inducible protein OsmY
VFSDEELEYRIQRLLEVSPFVKGDTVMVHVEYGITILSVHLEDRNAMVDAVEIAYDSGATNVKNHLRIRELTHAIRRTGIFLLNVPDI